jgi:uncharacterized repeat protein (TIGR03803 family)
MVACREVVEAVLVRNAGSLYGTTTVGGPYSSGVVFKLSP